MYTYENMCVYNPVLYARGYRLPHILRLYSLGCEGDSVNSLAHCSLDWVGSWTAKVSYRPNESRTFSRVSQY